MRLADAVATLRQYLPAGAILVGQNVGKDVEWLKLREGADFKVPSAASAQALPDTLAGRAVIRAAHQYLVQVDVSVLEVGVSVLTYALIAVKLAWSLVSVADSLSQHSIAERDANNRLDRVLPGPLGTWHARCSNLSMPDAEQ